MRKKSWLVIASILLACIASGLTTWVWLADPCVHYQISPHESPPLAVFDSLGDATTSRACRYAATDDLGQGLDCLNVIETSTGVYHGVHHHFNGTSFNVHLVNSTDLITWHFVCVLAFEASMPVIERDAASNAYYVAHEQWQQANTTGPCWIKFRYYPTLDHLRNATTTKTYQTTRTLSDLEGTPTFYSISAGGTEIRIGLHYNSENGLDRVATGVLHGLLSSNPSWTATPWVEYNRVLECKWIQGHIGAREVGLLWGRFYSLQEAQLRKDDWSTWRSFLYSWDDGGFWPLEIKTHGGSTAFSNPHFRVVSDPLNSSRTAIIVTHFVHAAGAAAGEAGPMLFVKPVSP
ncbi:MAG: hypothetical protein GYA24_23060 [Candidatus Lokiarchaeota archaeon]|nr:hypothetical protein [Candidatus Lokiarchaeota archaeon]